MNSGDSLFTLKNSGDMVFSFFFYTMSPLEKKKKEEMEKKKEKEKTMSPLFCYVNSGEQLHC
jgi:hypothetical protein